MNLKDNLINSLSGEEVEITPVVSVTQVGIVEAMQKTDAFWPDAHTNAAKMATLGSSLYELAGLECARIPFDLTVEADAMGCRVDLGVEDRTPQITKSPFDSSSDIKVPEDFLERGRIQVVLEAVKKLKEKYGNSLPIVVGMTGPLTLAGQLLGIENLVRYMRSRPYEVESTLDKVLEASIQYANAICEIEPDVVCVADPTSAPDLIDPLQFKNMVKPILEDLSMEITTNKVLHICGSTEPIIRDMATAGFDGLSVEEKVDIAMAKEEIKGGGKTIRVGGRTVSMGTGDKTPKLVGNISTNQTLFMGSTADVKTEVKNVLKAGVDILAPSCGLAPQSPIVNIKAMVEARNEFHGI
ncbi:methylcobamide:CoM methyltransferase MtaA [Methanobacterium oryzae]|uniref:methylcobamide:CoM methyltransferase MtaA n=1 Tax=Methanobacterium oryzae TaxID=69540 RepID=UPI003D23B8DF